MAEVAALQGELPMLATPFDRGGQLDEEGLTRLIDHVLASEADGLAALGLAAEAHALADAERERLAERILA